MSTAAALALWVLSHGAAPTAVDVLIDGGEEFPLVRLSRGVSLATPDGPTFVCATRWGGPDAPPMASLGDRALVAGFRGLVSIDASRALLDVPTPVALDGATTRALVASGDAAAGLDTDGNIVLLAPGAPRIRATLDGADSLAFEGEGLVVVGATKGVLTLWRMDLGEAEPVGLPVAVDYDATPTVAVLGGVVYFRGASTDGYRLDRLDVDLLTTLTTSLDPIHGPVEFEGVTYVIISGRPHRLEGDVLVALAESPRLTCLRTVASRGLVACALPNLVELGTDGVVGDTVYTFSDLLPPSLEGLDELDTQRCQLDWYDIATDAGFPEDKRIPEAWRPGAAESVSGAEIGAEAGEDTSVVAADGGVSEVAVSGGDCSAAHRQTPWSLTPSLVLFGLWVLYSGRGRSFSSRM